jgi:AcrR family transcriptional regulator
MMRGMTLQETDRSLPLRERKKLRNRRALAEAALRLFTAKGFDETTLEELADAADVSKSTFSRIFPAKEAAGIEAETELWTAFLAVLDERELSGVLFGELHAALADAVTGLDPGWDQRFIDTRRMVANEPALLRYIEHYRASVKDELAAHLAAKLALDPDDLRLRTLVELTILAWSVSGRHWVYNGGQGGREALLRRLDGAIEAIPASLEMSAPA